MLMIITKEKNISTKTCVASILPVNCGPEQTCETATLGGRLLYCMFVIKISDICTIEGKEIPRGGFNAHSTLWDVCNDDKFVRIHKSENVIEEGKGMRTYPKRAATL